MHGGAEQWELKVVQVHQISAGVHRPDRLGDTQATHVLKLLVLVWQIGEALLPTEDMLCKRALIQDWE